MNKPFFIPVTIIKNDGNKHRRFINTNHIIQVYEEDGNIFIELTEFTTYKIETPSIDVFMDHFARQHIYYK